MHKLSSTIRLVSKKSSTIRLSEKNVLLLDEYICTWCKTILFGYIRQSLNSFKKKEQINSTINQPISPNLITN
jgi:hypothetical protein